MADFRVVRRPRRAALTAAAPPRAVAPIVAAVAPVTDPVKQLRAPAGLGGRKQDWQTEAWTFYDLVGEFRFFVGWKAEACGRCRLIASEVGPDGIPTGSVAEDDAAGQELAAMVAAIAGGPAGQSQMVRRLVEVLSVPGEVWLAIIVLPTGERWVPLSRDEITVTSSGGVEFELPDGEKHVFDRAAGDGLLRIWKPHPKKASLADSSVRACLGPLRQIVASSATIDQAASSRLANNGILFIPSEASLPASAPGPLATGPGGDDAEPVDLPIETQLQDLILETAKEAAKDPTGAAAITPIVASAPGEVLKNIVHLPLRTDVTDVALSTRDKAIARLAMGLDMSPERLTGMGKTNHWSIRGIEDQDVQLYIKPPLQLVCQAIYAAVLAPMLEKKGIDPARYALWFNASQITADPDKTAESAEAYKAGAITHDAYLRYQGLAEDSAYDLDTAEGLRVWAWDRVSADPKLLPTLAPLLGSVVDAIDFPAPAALPPGDNNTTPNEPASPPPGEQEPATGQPAAGVEAAMVATFAARALELAGKRRVNTRDEVQRDRLRGTPAHLYHRVMGPVAEADVPRLIAGWDSTLNDDLLAGMGLSPLRVRAAVVERVRRELTAAVVDGTVV